MYWRLRHSSLCFPLLKSQSHITAIAISVLGKDDHDPGAGNVLVPYALKSQFIKYLADDLRLNVEVIAHFTDASALQKQPTHGLDPLTVGHCNPAQAVNSDVDSRVVNYPVLRERDGLPVRPGLAVFLAAAIGPVREMVLVIMQLLCGLTALLVYPADSNLIALGNRAAADLARKRDNGSPILTPAPVVFQQA